MTQTGRVTSPSQHLRKGAAALVIALTWLGVPAQVLALPDLMALELQQEPPNAPVNTGEISVKISNLGDSTTLFINLDTGFYIDGYLCDTFTKLGGLGGDSSKVFTTDKCNPSTPGPHTIQVVVDYTLEVEESNETNNSVSKTFLWYDGDQCDPTEQCNGQDDNCNGQIDESFYELGQPCDGPDEDSCPQGTYVCNGSGTGVVCDEPQGLQTELCNGIDDDCDGTTDEGFEVTGEPCSVQEGTCSIEGTWVCSANGLESECQGAPVNTGLEICNGVDDDCDGSKDEDYPFVGGTCLVGQGVCRELGQGYCNQNGPECNATSAFPPTPEETCGNREDDNCNGVEEEGCICPPGSYVPCGPTVGACQSGFMECQEDGTFSGKCTGVVLPEVEICGNDTDDDCDGSIDEGCPCVSGFVRPCTPGAGVCSNGNQTCLGGFWGLCVHKQEPSIEKCDGVDNDCDGVRDEGCTCFPGDLMLCEEQRDQCAEYYRICTETFRWTPCMAKPGTEDPYCGNPPEEDTSVTPDIETTQESDTSSDRGLDVSGGTTNESDGTSGEAQPQKVIIVQQAEGGCHPSEGLPPFFSLLSFLSLAVLFSRRTGKSGS